MHHLLSFVIIMKAREVVHTCVRAHCRVGAVALELVIRGDGADALPSSSSYPLVHSYAS